MTKLYLAGTQVRDLSVVKDMPLVELDLSGCNFIKDLGPLATSQKLEKLALPRHFTNLEPLRLLYNLKFIGYANSEKDWDKLLPVADFWKAYDERKK